MLADLSLRVVAVANGSYGKLHPLERAVPDTEELTALLESRHGFEVVLLPDRFSGALRDAIDEELAEGTLPGGALIVLWTGHGTPGADGQLRLLGRRNEQDDTEVATPRQLGEWAARTGASQVLVVIDTCYSGSGVPAALTMANAVLDGRADRSAAWFGVVSASRGEEPALSGALPRELKRLLSEGPADAALRLRWSAYDARVRADDLIDALIKEWSEERQSPQVAATGNPWPMLRNPLHRPRATEQVVEHLLQAARGTSGEESFFTGREAVLERLVTWLHARTPGLVVVTGPPGSGKSAIAGRIVSLSVPEERQRLLQPEPPEERLDPGPSSVDAHLHARGLDTRTAVEALTAQLGLEAEATIYDLLGLAARRRTADTPLAIVLDGLDEAGDLECRELAVQVIEPLAREALLLVATREVPGAAGEVGLLTLLGPTADTIDLGADPEATLDDVHRYVVRRLTGVAPEMDPVLVADEVVRKARGSGATWEGPFLLARLITSQLQANPVATAGDGWQAQLATSVETALERDLAGAVLVVGGREHPAAARELLRALSCAQGSGFPADDVWPAVATALSPSGTTYGRDDAYTLLLALGRHVVAGAEGDQAVYRVAHQRLVEQLRPTVGVGPTRRLAPELAVPVAETVAALYESLLEQGQTPQQHTYLWRHAWRHFAEAGPAGLEIMRRFVARDRKAFLPDLALTLNLIASRSWWSGSPADAVALQEEAVAIQRELENPLALALALFELATTRVSAGDAKGADDAAAEAAQYARQVADAHAGRAALSAALVARALTQQRQGNAASALRLAREVVAIAEAALAEQPTLTGILVSGTAVGAQAALQAGDLAEADALSRRAIEVVDSWTERPSTYEVTLTDLLATRARIEFALSAFFAGSIAVGETAAPEPTGPAAATRIVAMFRERGPTRTISDIGSAEGMRLLAGTRLLEQLRYGTAAPAGPEPLELLDEAIALLSELPADSVDAAMALAVTRTTRARLLSAADAARAVEELIEAERLLRPLIEMPGAALALGEVLHLQNTLGYPREAELAARIDRQREAINLLRRMEVHFIGHLLVEAYDHLIQLLEAAGRMDEATFERQAEVQVRRKLPGAHAVQLAARLVDLAALLLLTRPIEAAAHADEALDLLAPLEASEPAVAVLRGIALYHLSTARRVLGQVDEGGELLRQATILLEAGSATPLAGMLGRAILDLASLHLASGESGAALERARESLAIFARPDVEVPATVSGLARVIEGSALRAAGHEEEGAATLRAGIADLRAALTNDETTLASFAAALNNAGSDMWDEALADLSEHQPALVKALVLHRVRPIDQIELTVSELLGRLEEAAGDGVETRNVRAAARARRLVAPERFDSAWRAAAGMVPDWLELPPTLEPLVVAWWNTLSWRASRDYLLSHPDLLDPATELVIAELRDAGANPDLASRHLELLAGARAHGVERAYAPFLAEILVNEWLGAEDDEEFHTRHHEELLGADVAAVLEARREVGDPVAAAALAVLTLTRRAEQAVAFKILHEPEFGLTLLPSALRASDLERLDALATLCRHVHEADSREHRLATVALAVARALGGRGAEAAALAADAVAGIADEQERERVVGVVTEALHHQHEGQEELLPLLRALRPRSKTP
jgi:hypothetical protein